MTTNQKDKGQKLLEDYNDVFADIVNALLFQGQSMQPYPVVTLILYCGQQRWPENALSLKKRLNVPEPLAHYVSDYKINVFELAQLTREQARLKVLLKVNSMRA